jgi:hypothetical protein
MPNADAIYAVQVFAIRWQQGRLAELRPIVASLVESSPNIPAWRCALALVDAELGDVPQALAQLNSIGDFAELPQDWLWMPSVTTATQACVQVGATDKAAVLYGLLRPYSRRQVVIGSGFCCLGSASRYLGLLAAAMGQDDQARAYLAEAIDANDRMGAAPWAALSRCDLATVLLRWDERTEGRSMAVMARDTGSALGMRRLVDQASSLVAESEVASPTNVSG